ncbi:MAG TPA: GntR family transcriptional regulator [Trebonia sp.]
MTAAAGAALPKYLRVAAAIRRQIADGALRPGQPAPSGAELSRAFGFSTLTCRKALRALIAEGLLVPGPSSNARPRVADPQAPELERDLADAARALSAGLAARRHAAGLTQAELAALARVSVTTVGHAETGRTWQSRRFWERADDALRASGDLIGLHDAFRAASSPQRGQRSTTDSIERSVGPTRLANASSRTAAATAGLFCRDAAHATAGQVGPPRVGSAPVGPSRIVIVWTDGSITTVHAPDVFTGPPDVTRPHLEGRQPRTANPAQGTEAQDAPPG